MPKILERAALRKLQRKKLEMLEELKRISEAIRVLEGADRLPEVPWSRRALDCIKGRNEFLRTIDILECMFFGKAEILDDPIRRRNYFVALSIALNKLCKTGVLSRFPATGVKGYYYGLSEWTNNKKMKKEYAMKVQAFLKEAV